jgi:hygromycin-B 4-O-kinase
MAQKPNIPIEDTLQFLQDKFNNGVTELTLLSGGEWSQAYSFMYQGKKYVLRWCHSSETFEKDAFASAFRSEAMPIPEIMDSGRQFDTYFAISAFAEGKFIDTLTSAELSEVMPALLDLFDALRNADLSRTSGYGGWDKNGVGDDPSWKAFLLSVKDVDPNGVQRDWYVNLTQSEMGTAIFDQLYSQFEGLVEKCPEVRELIHSDLLHFNVLVSGDKISAVIDWQCGLFGDSFYDVAWFLFYAPWYPQFEGAQLCQKLMAHVEAATTYQADLQARLLCYQLHIGLGSIAYNSFKKDWAAAREAAEYTLKLVQESNLV